MEGRRNGRSVPLWRETFDAIERPMARASEAWVQSELFMDALAVTWKVQRRLTRRLQAGVAGWMRLWDLPTAADVRRVANQVASLERELRELTREVEGARGRTTGQWRRG